MSPQSYSNHTRFVPLYHFFVLPALAANLFMSIWRAVETPGAERILAAIVAAALMIGLLFARIFALTAQDRIIRLEMRLRLASLLPADLRARIVDLTPAQPVGLRFASDDELPDLVARVLRDQVKDKKAIKQMIKKWEGDELRV
jgi:hypothetical protein